MSEGSPCPPPIIVKKCGTRQWGSFFLPLRQKLLKLKISPCVKSGCLHFPILLRWVYPLCIIMHLYIATKSAATIDDACAKYNGNVVFLRVVNDCSLPRPGNQ